MATQPTETIHTPTLQLAGKPIPELFSMYAAIADELRQRGIMRTSNNLVGDLAEYLFSQAMGWKLSDNSQCGYDAEHTEGIQRTTFQIKGRRLTPQNPSRQLGALRDLELDGSFDYLAAVLFNPDYTVQRAIILPRQQVLQASTFIERTNSHKFHLLDSAWDLPGAQDVTDRLRAVVWTSTELETHS
jgi:hypothetical protein